MSFVSFSFLWLLAGTVLYRLTLGRRKTETGYLAVLLGSSLLFYLWHVPSYVLIIVSSICVDYLAGLWLGQPNRSELSRRLVLTLSLVVNLGLLFVFKYTNFFLGEVASLAAAMGWELSVPTLNWVLPMGISFYTFQSMSYTIDVYRRVLPAYENLWKFALFVSFFPQLMAGPIVRAKEFLYQIDRKRRVHARVFLEGLYLIIRGYFLKMVVADNLGVVLEDHWARAAEEGAGSGLAWAVAILFGMRIFCDFAGYSSVARGLAYLFGFRLPINFNSPYLSATFKEFWGRWHISLGRWLRDYLYISLGGNRRGEARTMLNLFLVMFLGGIWHGAAMTFLVWGVIHGVALGVERLLKLHERKSRLVAVLWYLVTQAVVMLAWVFFAAADNEQGARIVGHALSFQGLGFGRLPLATCALLILPPVLVHVRTWLVERGRLRAPGRIEKAVLAAVMLYATLTAFGVSNAFIYFQF